MSQHIILQDIELDYCTQIFTSNSMHNIYYSLLLQVSARGYRHFQAATKSKGVYSIYCKQSYVSGKYKYACVYIQS